MVSVESESTNMESEAIVSAEKSSAFAVSTFNPPFAIESFSVS
jgi:hypothetical protein